MSVKCWGLQSLIIPVAGHFLEMQDYLGISLFFWSGKKKPALLCQPLVQPGVAMWHVWSERCHRRFAVGARGSSWFPCGRESLQVVLFPSPALFLHLLWCLWASLEAQMINNLPIVQETWVRSLGREDPLEKGMALHSSILAWRIPWTEEPGGLQSVGSQRVKRTGRLTAHTWRGSSRWLTTSWDTGVP